jgi:hypothetical protein
MEVKIMTLAAVDVAAKGAHWELVAVAHIYCHVVVVLVWFNTVVKHYQSPK